MTVETAPRSQTSVKRPANEVAALAGSTTPTPSPDRPTSRKSAETRIRIHKDNLLIARCRATGLGPGRLFVSIDPLHYPVNSRLALEFVSDSARALLTATVTARNPKGIELKLDPATV